MTTSPRTVSWRMYGLAFAIALSPALMQTEPTCAQPGDTTLSEFQFRVFSQDHINFDSDQRVYYVWLPSAADTADVVAYSTDTEAEVSYQYLDANEELIDAGWFSSFVGGGTMTLDGSLIPGRSIFRVYVKTAGTTFAKNYTAIIQVGCSNCDDGDACTDDSCDPVVDVCVHDGLCGFPCTEQGIRDAIAQGGGPHNFTCDGPTTVETNATIIIDKDVILDGGGLLTVDGQNDHRVFYVYPYTVELRGMTITQGGGDVTYGGGIRNEGTLTLLDVAVTDSTATGHGGAIYHHGPSMDLTRVTLTGNTANIGGAIAADSQGPLTITDSVLSDNHVSAFGGALRTSTTTTVNRSTFSHNMGLFGGAIMVYQDGALALYDSTVSGNRAQTGGGIYTYGDLVLDGSVVSDNVVTHGGGGINQYEGTVALSNATVSGNSAQNGGGIAATAYAPSTSSLTAINTTISGNSAQYGGGMYAAGSASVALAHVTVSGNTAGHEGSAGYGTDTVTVTYKNNLIEGTCAAGSTTGTIISYGHNIESPGNTCFLLQPTDITGVTPGNLGIGALQDNGGQTLTHAPLSAASVAYNAVPAAACTDHGGAPLVFDQRGFPRPDGLDCDAGAVEGTCPDCSDGVLCTQDRCDPVLQACTNPSVVCPTDDIECTMDVCDPATGFCNVTDGTLCASGVGLCMAGVCDLCAGVTCPDDGNECTVDDCDWAIGACYQPRSDGSSCAGGAGQCIDGVCDLCVDVTCPDDGNECTVDTCEPSTGCVYEPVPDGTSCDSGHAVCSSGTCRGPEFIGSTWYRGAGRLPAVAMDPSGNGIAVWNQCDDWCGFGGTERLLGRYYSATDGWDQSLFRIDNVDDADASPPDVAMDRDGNAVAVWAQYFPGVGYVVNASYYAAGVGWDPPVPISEPFSGPTGWETIGPIDVEMTANGRAVVVWQETENDELGHFVARELLGNKMNFPGVWQQDGPTVLSTPTTGYPLGQDLALSWFGGGGWVVWEDTAEGVIKARETTLDWEPLVTLGQPTSSGSSQPKVVVDTDGNAIAVWRQSQTEIWTRRFDGYAWSDPPDVLVSADLADPWFYLALAVPPFRVPFPQAEEAVVAWTEDDNPNPTEWTTTNLWTKRYTPSGPSPGWGPAEPIETHDGKVHDPDIALDMEGNAVAAWTRCPADLDDTGFYSCDEPTEVWINRYRQTPYPNLGPDGWTTAERIEFLPDVNYDSPMIAMVPYREGIVVWGDGPYAQNVRWTSAPAPTLSNGRATHEPPYFCPPDNYFRLQVDYWDPDGDMVESPPEYVVRVFEELFWSNSTPGFQQAIEYPQEPPNIIQVSGNGFSGTVTANPCLYFGAAEWVDVTLTIWDAANNESLNSVTMRVTKPAGAD